MSSGNEKDKEGQKKHAHIILEPDRLERFEAVKEAYNLNSDVDVLRYCIDEIYELSKKPVLELREVLKQQAEIILSNQYLSDRYLVLNLNDIINEAVHQWIKARKSEINLHHVPFRQNLSDDEQKVALVFAEQQFDYEKGLNLQTIKEQVKGVSELHIKRILQKFVDNNLLTVSEIENEKYYYAPLP